MKKLLYSLLAVATLGLAAGCQREKAIDPADGPAVDVSFNVSLQGLQTKAEAAFSDGTKAKDLYVLVYANRTEGKVLLESVSQDFTGAFADGLATTVTLKLIRGENYDIVFWAQAPNAPYTLDKTAGTITVATEGLANDELRDAFYTVWSQQVDPAGSHSYPVELRRPFAQINVLTTADDWAAMQANQIQFAGSSLTIEAPSVLNLVTGEAGTPKEYKLAQNAIDPEAVNIDGYDVSKFKYVAMNYILAGDRATTDLSFGVYRAADDLLFDYAVPSVPYQRNWRTIIKGSVFSIDGEFNVEIIPDYDGTIDPENPTYWIDPITPDNGSLEVDAPDPLEFEEGTPIKVIVTPDADCTLKELFWVLAEEWDADETTAVHHAIDQKTLTFNMPAGNIYILAVIVKNSVQPGGDKTDVIDLAFTGVSGTNYASWDGKKGSASDAEYAGKNAGGNSAIQLRSNDNEAGIVSTTSGGSLVKVKVAWNSNTTTTATRKVDIYGSNTAYASPADLYNETTRGTLIGSLTFGEETDEVIVPATASYSYVGIRSNNGALYLDEIDITWSDGGTTPVTPTTYTVSIADNIANGTVAVAGTATAFEAGTTVTLTVTPDNNYELNTLYYNEEGIDNAVPIAQDATGAYAFNMPANNVTVFASFKEKTVTPVANDGSKEHPFTVAEVRTYIDNLGDAGTVSTDEVYVKGIVSKVVTAYAAQYGNATFDIVDKAGDTDFFEAYRVLYLGNQKWVEGNPAIAVNDEVVVCGKVTYYAGKTLYETSWTQNTYAGYLYSLNGSTEAAAVPVITATDISGIPAAGVTNATTAVTITNIDNSWTVRANCDGTVVTDAAWANDVLTYTVAANTGAARSGKVTIYVIKDNDEYTKDINVSQLGASLGEYDSNVTMTKGTSCYDDNKITVNGTENVKNLKFGTSSNYGTATIALPAGTTKVTFYAVAWKGAAATMKFTVSDTESYSFNVAANDGATGSNQPYVITVTDSDKYTLTLNAALTADTTVTVETCAGETNSGKRAFLFGVQASE